MKRYLLDTHVLLWALYEPERLTANIRHIISDTPESVAISMVSIWEIAIKMAIGKLPSAKRFFDNLEMLESDIIAIDVRHIQMTLNLPHHHKDPFDRLLIAQAAIEKRIFITHDRQIENYPVKTLYT